MALTSKNARARHLSAGRPKPDEMGTKMKILLVSTCIFFGLCVGSSNAEDIDYDKLYQSIKVDVDKAFQRNRSLTITPEDGELSLNNCSDSTTIFGYENSGNENDQIEDLKELSYEVETLQYALRTSGFPDYIYMDTLSEYEKGNIAKIKSKMTPPSAFEAYKGSPILKMLAREANAYRKSSKNPSLPAVTPEAPGCGDGEVVVQLHTTPTAKRIQYINKLNYDICKFTGKTPDDDNSCPYWADYNRSNPSRSEDGMMMSGNYSIIVTWPDGSKSQRNLRVDDLHLDEGLVGRFDIKE